MPPCEAAACPLCLAPTNALESVCGRSFFDCATCRLVHVLPSQRLAPKEEQAHYELHQNDANDVRYRKFLARLADPLLARLHPGMIGLDYGSGPGPTLSVMLEERGFPTEVYDPFFAPDASVLRQKYDFITCTEAAEHFFSPRQEFFRLARIVKAGGVLAVMTEVFEDERKLKNWSYARDPTHVCFYRETTFEWLATFMDAGLSRPHPNVAMFHFNERDARILCRE